MTKLTDRVVAPTRPRLRLVRGAAVVVAVAIAAVVLGAVAGSRLRPHAYAGTALDPPWPAPELDLVTHTGQPVHFTDLRGRVVLLAFGYTNCPDVCPATMATAAWALDRLGEASDRVTVMMVTVDPERDTPTELGAFVTRFDPRFLGLRGTPEQTAGAAARYGVHAGAGSGGVEHTAGLRAIDGRGRLRVIYPSDVSPTDLAADLRALLGG